MCPHFEFNSTAYFSISNDDKFRNRISSGINRTDRSRQGGGGMGRLGVGEYGRCVGMGIGGGMGREYG